jgi:hypothetical protein
MSDENCVSTLETENYIQNNERINQITAHSSADAADIVPMLSQQNQALQDMVKVYQNEISQLRQFSNDERQIYENQIQKLQNDLKENRMVHNNNNICASIPNNKQVCKS